MVEKGIVESSVNEGARNALFDITMATYAINEASKYLPTFLAQIDDPRVSMNYYFHRGYLFSLNYYKDNPATLEENIIRIENLIEIGLAISKMEDFVEKGIKKDFYEEKIKQGLDMLVQESKALLKEEIITRDLLKYLINVQDKKGYLENILGIKNKKRRGDLAQFLLDFLKTSF